MDEHALYIQKQKQLYRTLELVLEGHAPNWSKIKKEALDIREIAELNGYRVMDGNSTGRPLPWTILLADPGNYDQHVHDVIAEIVKSFKPVVLLDGYNGSVKNGRADGTRAQLTIQDGEVVKFITATDCTKHGVEGWQIIYDDNVASLNNLLSASRKSHAEFMKAVEERNYNTISPNIIRHKNRTVIQKMGMADALEGSVQQNLAMEDIPYLVLVPTKVGWKRQNLMRDEITPFIQNNIVKTIDRITEE